MDPIYSDKHIDDLIHFFRGSSSRGATGSIMKILSSAFKPKVNTAEEAVKMIKHYIYETNSAERNDVTTEKIIVLYDLLLVQKEASVAEIKRSSLERLMKEKKPVKSLPSTPISLNLKDSERKPYLVDPALLPKTSAKLLAQLMGDEFIENSKLEGGLSKEIIEYVLAYIQQMYKEGRRLCENEEALIHELTVAFEISSSKEMDVTLNQALVKSFEENKPFLIPGGWIGVPFGHAVYYEVIPDVNTQTATIRLFNTGEGLYEHPKAQVGLKLKASYVEWRGVAKENLLNPNFARAVMEMTTKIESGFLKERTNYTFKDLYFKLKALLEVKEVVNQEAHLNAPFSQAQLSGTCSCRALMAFIKTKMSPNEFRHFKCDIRIQALQSEVLRQPLTFDGVVRWRLVQKSTKHLARKIHKLYQVKKAIGVEYLKEAEKVLSQVEESVKTSRKIVLREGIQISTKLSYSKPNLDLPKLTEPKPLSEMGLIQLKKTSSVRVIQIREEMQFALNDPKTILNEISAARVVLEKALPGDYEKQVVKIEELIQKLNQNNTDNFFSNQSLKILEIIGHIKGSVTHAQAEMHAEALLSLVKEVKQVNELENEVKLLLDLTKRSGDQIAIYFESLDLIKKLPLDKEFWNKVPCGVQESENAIADFNAISDLFFQSSLHTPQAEISYPEKAYALKKLVLLQEPFAERLDERIGLWPRKIPFEMGVSSADSRLSSESHKNYFFQFHDEKMQREWLAMHEIREEGRGFNLFGRDKRPLFFLNVDPVGNKIDLQHKDDKGSLCRDIVQKKYPAIWAKIEENYNMTHRLKINRGEVKEFRYLELKKQDQEIYLSEALPLWILNLINMERRAFFSEYAAQNPASYERSQIKSYLPRKFVCEALSAHETRVILSRVSKANTQLTYLNTQIASSGETLSTFIRSYIFKEGEVEFRANDFSCIRKQIEGKMDLELSDEELKQISHVFTSSQYAPIEFIEFFTRNPGLLHKTFLQNLFQAACFGMIQTKEASFGGLVPLIKAFLKKSLEYSEGQGDKKTIVFLLRMGRYFSHYEGLAKLWDEEAQLLKLLQSKDLKEEEMSILYQELAAYYSELESLTSSQIEELVLGLAIIRDVPIPLAYKSPKSEWEGIKALEKHSKAILNHFASDQEALNTIYRKVTGFKASGSWEGVAPEFKIEGVAYFNPLKAELIILEGDRYLPAELVEEPVMRQLFPNQKRGRALENKVFEIQDHAHNVYFVKKEERAVVIERKIEGAFYRLCVDLITEENGVAKSSLQSRYLAENFEAWQSLDEPNTWFLLDPISKKPLYKTDSQTIIRLSDSALLGDRESAFENFEQSSYVHAWFDQDKNLKQIELPRYSLSFNNLFECEQYPGFFVDQEQSVDVLGSLSDHIVLIDRKGKRKVLIPDHILGPVENKESQKPAFGIEKYQKKGEIGTFNHFVYDLTPQGIPVAATREGYFLLIKVLLIHHEYDFAMKLLRRHGEKLSAYTPEEQKRLEDLLDVKKITGDCSGNQNAVALLAAYLLSSNPAHSKKATLQLPELYRQYLMRFTHSQVLDFTKAEELRLLKRLFATRYEPNLLFRLRELDPDYAEAVTQKSAGISQEERSYSRGFSYRIPSPNYPRLTPEDEKSILVTRSSRALSIYFCDYVREAIQGSPEKKAWLKAASLFLIHSEDDDDYSLGIIFREILKQPDKFRLPPEPTASQEELSKWMDDLVSNFRWGEHDVFSSKPAITSTPEHFRLEKEVKPLPEIPFEFTSVKVEPLKVSGTLFKQTIQRVENTTEFERWLELQVTELDVKENPLEVLEWRRLGSDLSEFTSRAPKTLYSLEGTLKSVTEALQSGDEIKEINKLSDQMLELVNRLPSEDSERLLYQIGRMGGGQKLITLDDIFISFALKKPNFLKRINQTLSENELKTVYSLACRYLELATLRQQKDRALALVKELQELPKGAERDQIEQQLGEMIHQQRAYDPNRDTAYLVFEYYADILMRPDQKEILDKFLGGEKANPIMEMIMGSGKSKVLLPLLGLLRADGKILSLLIVPEPLFESVSTDTQNSLKLFGKNLRTLHFDRNTVFNKTSLEEIRDLLQDTMESEESLIMTSKSIGALLLKFIEYSKDTAEKGHLATDELFLMQEIMGFIRNFASPLIDEADTVMSVLHELSFSIGKKVPPNQAEIDLVGQLYDLLYNDPELKKIARLESDPYGNPNAPPLTEELYFSELQGKLSEAFLKKLEEKEAFHDLIASNRPILLAYLCRDKELLPQAQSFYNTLPQELKEIFALGGEEISHLLPHSLLRVSDERYGLDQGVISIPFGAVNTPSKGSLFANAHVTMNYTYQIHNKKGIDRLTLISEVRRLKKLADIQLAESGGKKSIAETDAWRAFCVLRGDHEVPLINDLSEHHIKVLLGYINSSADIRRNITRNVFLPTMELFESKLSCNPIDFVSLFLSTVLGFTGTLWNGSSMHRKICPLPQIGTDARTLSLLWKMGQSSDSVTLLTKEKIENQLGSFDLISDAGGYFKEGGNLLMARQLAIKYQKPVVFYNKKGEQTLTDGVKEWPFSSDKALEKDQRLTFLDQSHTTGADVAQKGHAIGLVTIGRTCSLRDLLQSVWRLRGLEKGQKVRYLIDEEVASIIRERTGLNKNDPITFKQILKFSVQNQSKQQGHDNFTSFKQQIWGLPHMLLIDVLLDDTISLKNKEKALGLLIDTWIKPTQLTPSILYGAPPMQALSHVVIDDEGEKAKRFLLKVKEQMPLLKNKIDPCLLEINDAIERTKTKVHPKIICHLSEDAGTVEIEQDVKATTHVTVETESSGYDLSGTRGFCKGLMKRVSDISNSSLTASSVAVFPLQRAMERDKSLKDFAKEFEGIEISINILEWGRYDNNKLNMQLVGTGRIPFHHLLVKGDEVTLLSAYEEQLQNPNYYNIYLGYKDPKKQPSRGAAQKIVKLKFLNGESSYTTEERLFLKLWIHEANKRHGAKSMEKLFLKVILNNQIDKKKHFEGSALEDLFRELEG